MPKSVKAIHFENKDEKEVPSHNGNVGKEETRDMVDELVNYDLETDKPV